jgi:thiol-disulfide isomerase/thioredoxin
VWLLLIACAPRLYTDADSDTDVVVWTQPENVWVQATPPAELVATGWYPGEVPEDLRLEDQHGDVVSLWQFYGRLVLVDVSTIWCAPCRDLAAETENVQLEYDMQGFVYVTVLSEDVEGDPPDNADLNQWADAFGITSAPVIADVSHDVANTLTPNGTFPVLVLIGRDMVVDEWVAPATDAALRAAIEAHLE